MRKLLLFFAGAALLCQTSAAVELPTGKQLIPASRLEKGMKTKNTATAASAQVATDKNIQLDGTNNTRKMLGARKADSNPTIEGTWTFSLGDYYFQTSTNSIIEVDFEATLNGTQVVFNDPAGEELPFTANFNSNTNELTFSTTYLGQSSPYYIYQEPFVYNWDTHDLDVQTIKATFTGTNINFSEDNGISWAAYSDQNGTAFAGYFSIYDLVGAEKAVEWILMEDATFNENLIYGTFQGEENTQTTSVEVYENPFTPGIYRVINPFGVLFKELKFNSVSPAMLIDATNPDNVLVEMQSTGISGGTDVGVYYYFNEGWYCEEFGEELDPELICTLTKDSDGYTVITFPYHSITLYAGTSGSFYYGSAYESVLRFKAPASSSEPEEGDITGNMTYQIDMNMGAFDEPDLMDPETIEVTASYNEDTKALTIYNFAELPNPITFTIDTATGNAVAADQLAEDYDDVLLYYSDFEKKEPTVFANAYTNDENKTVLLVDTWGEGADFGGEFGYFFFFVFYNTEVTLDCTIPGLAHKADAKTIEIGDVTYNLVSTEAGAMATFTLPVTTVGLDEGAVVAINNSLSTSAIQSGPDADGNYTVVIGGLEYNKDYSVTFSATSGNVTSNEVVVTFDTKNLGVNGIGTDNATSRYFNLQGVEVTNPAPGNVYIRISEGKAVKILAK